MSWLDNRKCAGWLAAGITCAHWACNCTVFEIPGVDGTNIAPDYMHNMFLGWLQYLYGSIMYMLVFVVMSGSHEDNLKQIAAFIKKIGMAKAPSTNTDRGLISFQCSKKKDFPRLRGRAADIMGLCDTMLALWKEHMTEALLQHRQVRLMLTLNKQIADTLEQYHPRNGYMAVPTDPSKELLSWGMSMAQVHSQLLEHYKTEGVHKVFNLTSKTHFALHSLQLSGHIHPALIWCFKGEATMRSLGRVWKSCLDGSKHFDVSARASYKLRHLVHLRNAKGG